jgi:hypothetical protein
MLHLRIRKQKGDLRSTTGSSAALFQRSAGGHLRLLLLSVANAMRMAAQPVPPTTASRTPSSKQRNVAESYQEKIHYE